VSPVDVPVRTVVVWCDEWPAVASGPVVDRPVAVIRANRIVSVTPMAHTAGVEVGQRRREAQRRCPQVELRERDPDREARVFEQVVGALDELTPRLEISQPGCVRFPARAPARYFGGDDAVAGRARSLVEAVMAGMAGTTGEAGIGVGIADGAFAATLAARQSSNQQSSNQQSSNQQSSNRQSSNQGARVAVVVPGEGSPEFLARFPVGVLVATGDAASSQLVEARRDLVDVLSRLGIRRLGELAALPVADVSARFGPVGLAAHRLASGQDLSPMYLADPPADLEVHAEPDPPLERVDQASFVAKGMADELIDGLRGRGLTASCVVVSAELAGGWCVERRWRHEGALSAAAVAQRVRWQLDGWLTDRKRFGEGRLSEQRGAIIRLTLRPEDIGHDRGRQAGFWGGDDGTGERVVQSLARVQSLVGADAVQVAEWRGGRGPAGQYQLVPLDTVDLDALAGSGPEPWPGRLVGVAPALVWSPPRPVQVLDIGEAVLRVDGRGLLSGEPAWVVDRGRLAVAAWAGPWVTDERWWDPVAHRRRARIQAQLDDGSVHLVVLEAGRWGIEATWD